MRSRKCLYLAAPLFSNSEREFNKKMATRLSKYVDVFLPQEQGNLFVDLVASGSGIQEAARKIFDCDTAAIRGCDILLIVLDGRTVDEGAAFELGYASALNKTCIGLQSDMRRLLPVGNNPMIESPLSFIGEDCDSVVIWLRQWLAKNDQSVPPVPLQQSRES